MARSQAGQGPPAAFCQLWAAVTGQTWHLPCPPNKQGRGNVLLKDTQGRLGYGCNELCQFLLQPLARQRWRPP